MSDPSVDYVCSSCGASFGLAPADPKRCPECMRTSGLVQRTDGARPAATSSAGGGRSMLVAIVLLVLAGGAVAAYVAMSGSDEPTAPSAPGADQPGAKPGQPILASPQPPAELPPELRGTPAEVDAAVRLAAGKLPDGAEAVVAAVAKARADGALPVRDPEAPQIGAPIAAGSLAAALGGEQPASPSGTLELAALAGALLDAKGIGPVSYGVAPSGKREATDVTARRYVVRAGADGAWLAPDGQPVDGAKVTALDAREWMANVLTWRALGAHANGDDALAAKAANQARVLAPTDAAALFTAGQMTLHRGLQDRGIAAMEEAAALNADAGTWLDLGKAAMRAQLAFKANQFFRKAAAADPEDVEPHVLLALLSLDRLRTTPKEQREARVTEAEEHLTKASAVDPNGRHIRLVRAQIALVNEDVAAAEKLLGEELEIRPADDTVLATLARLLFSTEQNDKAIALIDKAREQGHAGVETLTLIGVVMLQLGQLEPAAVLLEEALVKDPTSRTLRPELAAVLNALGQRDQARTKLLEHLKRFPDDVEAQLARAQLELEDGKYDASAAAIAEVAKTAPDHDGVLLLRYVLAIKIDNGLEAARAAALARFGARSELAQLIASQGLMGEAEKLLRDAIDKDPKDAPAPLVLYALLLATDRGDEAATFRKAAVEKTPEAKRANLEAEFDQVKERTLAPPEGAQAPEAPTAPDAPEAPEAPDAPEAPAPPATP